MKQRRIVWLAAADARGHLTRAHLMRRLLAAHNIDVTLITTGDDGQRYLAELGSPSTVLSTHYAILFDAWQNMKTAQTEAQIAKYFLLPQRAHRDLSTLQQLACDAEYIVNDFHPLLLLGGPKVGKVVHVFGASLRHAIAHHFEGRGPELLDRRFSSWVDSLLRRGFARVEHNVFTPPHGIFRASDKTFVLPPLVSVPDKSPHDVRRSLNLPKHQKLAAVYLNPHFQDPHLATALQQVLSERGYHLYGVSERLAHLQGFRPVDAHFANIAFAADVLISAPGMATCSQVRTFGLPFVALTTRQPEQQVNLANLQKHHPVQPVDLTDPGVRSNLTLCLHQALERAEALRTQRSPSNEFGPDGEVIRNVQHSWARVFTSLIAGHSPPTYIFNSSTHKHPFSNSTHEVLS
ncbi:MAG: hypothetical protein IPK82_07925 [Polyangiaceae bacterium]|nr:hypothetical protein [Polyangiaceae bacterium]